MAWTKLHREIVVSSIWGEPYPTRIVWITMLATSDADGNVMGSIPGLARLSNVTRAEAEMALQSFFSPDPDSRCPDNDGRRIEAISGGWRILNFSKYRARHLSEEEREAAKLRMRAHRAKQSPPSPPLKDKDKNPDTEAEADAENITPVRTVTHEQESNEGSLFVLPKAQKQTDEEWLEAISKKPAYAGISIKDQYEKMILWCSVNNRKPSRRLFINWLNRADKPMASKATNGHPNDRNIGGGATWDATAPGGEDDVPDFTLLEAQRPMASGSPRV